MRNPTSSWMSAVLSRDSQLRDLQRRLDRRIRQWEIRHAVIELRRLGEPQPVTLVAERYGVTRRTVQRALFDTSRVLRR